MFQISAMNHYIATHEILNISESTILLRIYLLKTLKYEFINCKPSEDKYVFQFPLNSLLFSLLLCYCSHLTDTTLIITITCLSDTTIRCSAHNLFVSTALIR